VPRKPRWTIVLQKETQAKREVLDKVDVFISTTVKTADITGPKVVPTPSQMSLIALQKKEPSKGLLPFESSPHRDVQPL